jgi:glycosyltransferase involved in cell wall biosynthesis
MKLYIATRYHGEDKGEGGIRRIVEAQRRYLPQLGVEIVEDMAQANIVCSHAGDEPNVPVDVPWVVHCHGLYWAEYQWADWAYKLNQQVAKAMRQADAVTAPSEWVAYALQRGMWLRPTILYHGIDPDMWAPGQNGGYVLWNKTRTDAICDPWPLDALATRLPTVPFVSTFGLGKVNVRVTGRLPFQRARTYIENADIYLATTRETMGIGTLEAMACGVPILGFRWGGQREIIEHQVTGWLATPGDIPGLVEGYHWLKENRDAVGARAREVCLERFTWPKVMKEYVDLYASLRFRKASPKVSVVMPCYNLARYLPSAIESVLNQSLKDWELVIVDDCSPDETPQIAAEYVAKDSRVRYVRNPENLYLAGALNAGIAVAQGRYILPLDADNLLSNVALEVLSDQLDKRRDIDIAYGRVQFVTDDLLPDKSIAEDGTSPWPPQFDFRQQIAHRNQIPSTCMFRRRVWERTGGYRSRWRTAEDAAFWTHATSYGFNAAKVTEQVTLIYRNRHDSMSHTIKEPDWTAWLPWSRDDSLIPFGAPVAWNKGQPKVPSYEPAVVTVIIPVGPGHEKLVIGALDSVEAQTLREWACIVINDTGHPLSVPHPWAKVIDTGGRKGVAVARNMGIEASTTECFVPLDADDILDPEALEEMWEWHKANPKALIYSQWWDDKGGEKPGVYDPPEWEPAHLLKKGCITAITALYPKGAWRAVGGFDPAMQNWEDWDFQIAMAAQGYCGCKIERPLWTYRKLTGHRREEALSEYKRGRDEMMRKWGDYFEGRKQLMGCGGCGSRKGAQAVSQAQITGETKREGAQMVVYVGRAPTITFVGKATGKRYRFGHDAGHQRRWVFQADIPGLLALPQNFRLAEEPPVRMEPVLQ